MSVENKLSKARINMTTKPLNIAKLEIQETLRRK